MMRENSTPQKQSRSTKPMAVIYRGVNLTINAVFMQPIFLLF
jgi:hypothetical protein